MENRAVILDNGDFSVKLGLAGDNTPCCSFSSVDDPLIIQKIFGHKEDLLVALEGFKTNVYGKIYSKHLNDNLWDYLMRENLNVFPWEHPLIITDGPQYPIEQKEKILEKVFEALGMPALYIAPPAVLTLYAINFLSALVIDIGHLTTYSMSISEGYSIPGAIKTQFLGAHDLDVYFEEQISNKVSWCIPPAYLRLIKENMCFVNNDPDDCYHSPRLYTLPDGKSLYIANEASLCPEILLNPKLISKEMAMGIHELIQCSILKSDIDLRKNLYRNIVLCGGSSMFPGLVERVNSEVSKLCPKGIQVKTLCPKDAQNSAWVGGSIFGCLPEFPKFCISKREYHDLGAFRAMEKKML